LHSIHPELTQCDYLCYYFIKVYVVAMSRSL
jgi:hypothetical protein